MADNTTKPSRSYRTEEGNVGHEFDEDPLVELARIVSEDGSFFQSTPANPAEQAESGARTDPFSADLEAELMEQFEASFAGAAAGAVDVSDAAEPEPAPEAESPSEYAQYAASDSQALGDMATEAETRSDEAISTDYERSEVYEAAADDRFAPFGAVDQIGDDLPADPPANPAIVPAVEPIEEPYRVAPDDTIARTAPGEPHPNVFEMEFAEALADTASPPLVEDFTPEFGVEAYGRGTEIQDSPAAGDGLSDYEADYSVSQYGEPLTDGDGNADDAYEASTAMPPPAPARSGGRKGLIAVAGVLAVVILGGGVAAYISKSASNDPATPAPVIKAEDGNVKIMADATDTAGTAPSMLDPLTGQQAKSEEKLIDRIEEPQQIARVVLPGPENGNTAQLAKPVGGQPVEPSDSLADEIGKTIDRVMQDTGQPAATPKFDPIGPRKVRTVIVKPDGSIVSNDNAPTLTQPASPVQPAPPAPKTMEVAAVGSTQSPEPMPVKTIEIASTPKPVEPTAIAGSDDTMANANPSPQPMQVATTEPLAPLTETGDAGNTLQAMEALAGVVPRPKPANVPDAVIARAPSAQAIQSTARSTREPVNLLAAAAETDQPRVTASTGPAQSGYVVQVSSQRSADQAQSAFATMQRRYKSVLGGFQPNIQRADLGAKGTYYRVRIGPMASRDAALRLCEQLKSAGGSCFVTR
jgi:hypothetical protein